MICRLQRTGSLTGRTVPPSALTASERLRMLDIMKTYFNSVGPDNFQADLEEKDFVILLTDSITGEIRGFSTQKFLSAQVAGRPVRAIFSGDTIVEKEYWRQTVLVKEWFSLVFRQLSDYPDIPLYWFLICMGYKTYRFLPVYFRTFYPSVNSACSSGQKEVLDALAGSRFGSQYDPERGIVRFAGIPVSLRQGFAEVPLGKHRDEDVCFFLERNPGYRRGEELACLARLHPDNFKPSVFRFAGGLAQRS